MNPTLRQWAIWLLAIYLAITAFQFFLGKMKNHTNPAGYIMPKITEQLKMQKSTISKK